MNERMQSMLRRIGPYLLILVAAYAVYFKALAFRVIGGDDALFVYQTHWALGNWGAIKSIFTGFLYPGVFEQFYRPVLMLSFLVDKAISGASLPFFHFMNIAIHVAACMALYRLLRGHFSVAASCLCAVVVCVHPALVSAVVWLGGRNDTLLMLFVCSSFLFLPGFLRSGRRAWVSYAAHLACVALALFTKESAIVFPMVMGAYLLIYERQRSNYSSVVALAAGWGSVITVWIIMRSHALGTASVSSALDMKALTGSMKQLLVYAGKAVVPLQYSLVPDGKTETVWYGVAVVVILAAVLWVTRTFRHGLFGSVWFLAFLLPTLALPHNIFFEHRLATPIVGLAFCCAAMYDALSNVKLRKIVTVSCIAVVVIFSVVSFVRSDHFISAITYWSQAKAESPRSPVARYSLGAILMELGCLDAAEQEFIACREIDPSCSQAYLNLGMLYLKKGMYERSEKELTTAMRLFPDFYFTYDVYGDLCAAAGRQAEAERWWQLSVSKNPQYAFAHEKLYRYYRSTGQLIKAETSLNGIKTSMTDEAFKRFLSLPDK